MAKPALLLTTCTYISPKYRLINGVEDSTASRQFYDLVGEVTKIYASPMGYFEVFITDYTTNNLLYHYPAPEDRDDRDGDLYGYTKGVNKEHVGPYGRMILMVEVHHPHSGYILENVKLGDIISINNVRAKIDNRGGKLEGSLFQDSRWPGKICVSHTPKSDQRVHDIVKRRLEYWDKRKHLDARGEIDSGKPVSKNQKKTANGKAISKRKQNKADRMRRKREEIKQAVERAQPTKKNPHSKFWHMVVVFASSLTITSIVYISGLTAYAVVPDTQQPSFGRYQIRRNSEKTPVRQHALSSLRARCRLLSP